VFGDADRKRKFITRFIATCVKAAGETR